MLLFMNVGMEKLGSSHSFVICTNDPQKYFMHAFPGNAKGISYAFCFLALFAIQGEIFYFYYFYACFLARTHTTQTQMRTKHNKNIKAK